MTSTLLSLLAILAVSNAAVPLKLRPKIVDGDDVNLGEIPYQVSLQMKGLFAHFCGGSILNENYVVTAAHCLDEQTPEKIEVVAGSVNLFVRRSVHDVEKIILHEDYSPSNSYQNDIALIKVKTPFVVSEDISFVNLPDPTDVVKANDEATVSGFGTIRWNGPTIKRLQRARVYVTKQSDCKTIYERIRETIHDSHICASDPEELRGACSGDSGGPLIVGEKLVGIVSWSFECGRPDYPTVFTRVSSYLKWIEDHVA